MEDKSIKIDRNRDFNEKGKFVKGNQIGRMPKKGFTLADLTKLVREYDRTQDISLLEHYVEQLRKDNRLLDKYVDRYVPVKTINELTGLGGSPMTFIIEKTYEKPEKGEKKELGNAKTQE